MAGCSEEIGIHICVGDMETNSVLVNNIAVDASLPLKMLPKKPRVLLITHGHADHFRYAFEYREIGVTIAAPRHCIPLIENPAINQMATIGWAGPIDEGLITRYFVGRGVRVDTLLEPGAVMNGVEAIAAPGHTPGHLIYVIETRDARVLVAGDTVLGINYLEKVAIPYHTSTVWLLGSLTRIRSLDVDVLVPGHGTIAMGKREALNIVDKNISQLYEALRLVEKLLPGPSEEPLYTDEVVSRLAEVLGYSRSKKAYSALSPTTRALLLALKYWGRAEALPYRGVLAWRKKR